MDAEGSKKEMEIQSRLNRMQNQQNKAQNTVENQVN